jgi:hypothetical protein
VPRIRVQCGGVAVTSDALSKIVRERIGVVTHIRCELEAPFDGRRCEGPFMALSTPGREGGAGKHLGDKGLIGRW